MMTGGRIVVWSAVLAGTLAAAAVLVAALSGGVTGDEALERLFDSLVTLTGAVLLTGVIGVAIDRANRARESRDTARAKRIELARRLRSVHSDVKLAALLIAAHRTARTYGEQMRALLNSRVEIGDVRFEIIQNETLDANTKDVLVLDLDGVANYLEKLTNEYRDQYLRISGIQLATHEWEVQQARALARRDRPPAPGEIVGSLVAWEELTRPDAFPRLADLLESLDREPAEDADEIPYVTQFSNPLRRAGRVLSV